MSDSHDTRPAAAAMIVPKHRALVAEHQELLQRREQMLHRFRKIAEELADCRAAARLFGVSDWLPPTDPIEHNSEQVIANQHVAAARRAALSAEQAAKWEEVSTGSDDLPELESINTQTQTKEAHLSRPPLREAVLNQLKLAGGTGSKAAPLREYFEKTYGVIIHEKTAGMTLYRLSQENLVHRDGHTWFFGPGSAGAGNPGVAAPGSDNRAD